MSRLVPSAALLLAALSSFGCTGEDRPGPLGVTVVSPVEGDVTSGAISIAASASDPAAAVRILLNGEVVANGTTFLWDTSSAPEGPHSISAIATLGDETATSAVVIVHVDRRPPELAGADPAVEAPEGWVGPIALAFDEAIDAASLALSPPTVTTDGGATLATTAALSEDGRTVEIHLPGGPLHTETLTVTVPPLRDRAGNATAAAGWTFRLPPLRVVMTPAAGSTTITNGVVLVEAEVLGGDAWAVTIMRGTSVLATFTAPPYRFAWDTRTAPEASVELTVKAFRGAGAEWEARALVVVDRTPPMVVGTTPADGDRNVARDETTEVRFSEPVAWLSVTGGITSSGCGPGQVNLALDRMVARVYAGGGVDCDEEILIAGVADLAGNVLAAPVTVRIARPAWLWLGGMGGEVRSPSLVLDGEGRPVVAYFEQGTTPTDVSVRRWSNGAWERLGTTSSFAAAGSAWGQVALAKILAGTAFYAAVAAGAMGDPYGAHAFMYDDALGWVHLGGPLNVNPARDLSLGLDATEDAEGDLWVGWKEFGTIDGLWSSGAYVQEYDASTKSWGPAHELHAPGARSPYDTRLAGGADGTVAAAWYEWVDSGTETHPEVFAERLVAGTWVPLPPLTPGREATAPDVEVADDGTVFVAWVEGASDAKSVRAARWDGAAWDPLGAALNLDPAGLPVNPRIALDREGLLLLAYTEEIQEVRTIRVLRWDGAVWASAGDALNADPSVDAYGCDLAARFGQPVLTMINGPSGGLWVRTDAR